MFTQNSNQSLFVGLLKRAPLLLGAAIAVSDSTASATVVTGLSRSDYPWLCGDNTMMDYLSSPELNDVCRNRDGDDWADRVFAVADTLFHYWTSGEYTWLLPNRHYRFISDGDISQFWVFTSDISGLGPEFVMPPRPRDIYNAELSCLADYTVCWNDEVGAWIVSSFFRVYDFSRQSTFVRLVDVTPAVSEPATLALLGAGVLGIAAVRRRESI